MDYTRYSSINKIVRIIAYAKRFVSKKVKKRSLTIIAEEYEDAEKILWQDIQKSHEPSQQIKAHLRLVKDDAELWRCRGRFLNSNLPIEAKFPIYVPKESWVTELLIKKVHQKAHHSGPGNTLLIIREKYWIPSGRRICRKVINQCLPCKIHLLKSFAIPQEPDLPDARVCQSEPFEHVGVDYFGPLITKEGGQSKKCYVALYTCLIVRAIHLEMADDLTAEAFLQTFRRFIARRGVPRTITSDNGTNFQLGEKLVKELWKNTAIQEFVAEKRIQWKFISERAPWFGGFYERMIGLVKHCLRRTIRKSILEKTDLHTILIEIETTINSRPLTFIKTEEIEQPLRPADFLLPGRQQSDLTIPRVVLDEEDPDFYPKPFNRDQLLKTLNKSHKKLEKFWKIWQTEYLQMLRERKANLRKDSEKNPKVGDMVIVFDGELSRNLWRMGRIKELIASSDGKIRSARFK